MTAPRSCLATSLFAAVFAGSFVAEAGARIEAPHGPVVITVEQCEQPLEAEVRRIVGVELRATVIEASGAGDDVTLVIATCRGMDVDLALVDGATAKQLQRTVALSEAAPTARARLVALAVAELVVAGRQEIEVPSASKAAVSSSTAPPPAAVPSHRTSAAPIAAMVDAMGVVRAIPGSGVWLLGAGARGLLAIAHPLYLALELDGEWGSTSRTPGQVAGRMLGGAVAAGWGMERRWAFLMPWLGVRGGVASLKGEPSPGSSISSGTQSGAFLGPEVGLAASLWPRAPVHVTVALSAGALLLGVRGKVVQDRDVSLQGAWIALAVGAGLSKP
jgi:hypothetical protein